MGSIFPNRWMRCGVVVVHECTVRRKEVPAVGPQSGCVSNLFALKGDLRVVWNLSEGFCRSKQTARAHKGGRYWLLRALVQQNTFRACQQYAIGSKSCRSRHGNACKACVLSGAEKWDGWLVSRDRAEAHFCDGLDQNSHPSHGQTGCGCQFARRSLHYPIVRSKFLLRAQPIPSL